MVNSRQKGAKAEMLVAVMLTKYTQLPFEQTPGSGSGKIKGDLYLKNKINKYLIEVKFYRDDAVTTKVFTNKSNNFVQWWAKTKLQAANMKQEPLLFFKANHAQFFVSTVQKPQKLEQYMHLPWLGAYICLAEQWLEHEPQEWTHGN
jgi:hypothetical protein|tara:strand:- start:1833 stop:2273 length:441 start_codon:yes stop_codon:yes gene_type:complete